MISDDDLQRIVLGNTPEGRILARVLSRLTALEANAEASRVRKVMLDAAHKAMAEKRIERLERTLIELADAFIDLINQIAPDPAHLAGPWEERLNAIRQDLAEMDRQRQPKEP